MSYSTIPQTSQFNTGFLPNFAEQRLKQGLLPQQLSNDCQQFSPGMANAPDTARVGGVCNSTLMYNFPVARWTYGPAHAFPMKDCACTRYIQPP